MERLTREKATLTWLLRGLRDFFFAFIVDEDEDGRFYNYAQFFNAMGFEMVCKAYLLATKSAEYESLDFDSARAKIDELAKSKMGHDIEKLVEEIKQFIAIQDVERLLDKDYDGYTGTQFITVMKAVYLESRYPVPNPIHEQFPVEGKTDMYKVPQLSSGLPKFCYAFTRMILTSLRDNFGITIPKSRFHMSIAGKDSKRFCNLFFWDTYNDFVSDSK